MNDLLLYAALLLILSTSVLAGIMTVTRFFSILGLWRTSPRMAWNSPIAALYFNHLGWLKVWNSFFVQAEFPAYGRQVCLLFHFSYFKIVSGMPQDDQLFFKQAGHRRIECLHRCWLLFRLSNDCYRFVPCMYKHRSWYYIWFLAYNNPKIHQYVGSFPLR